MAGERQEGELSHIIAKFAGELIEDDDDEEQVYDPDEEKKKILGCTQYQDYEFKVAFRVVQEVGDAMPAEKVSDLFLTLGYTLQDNDVDEFLEHCQPDKDGNYLCDTLLEQYDQWRREQLKLEDLAAAFQMIAVHKKLSRKLEQSFYTFSSPSELDDTYINVDALQNVLDSVLHNEQENGLPLKEAELVAREISTDSTHKISLENFLKLFT